MKNKAFTLLEVIIVMVIIVILAFICVPLLAAKRSSTSYHVVLYGNDGTVTQAWDSEGYVNNGEGMTYFTDKATHKQVQVHGQVVVTENSK